MRQIERFICMSDCHIRDKTPVCRKDNIKLVTKRKLSFIVDIANKYNAHIISGGDFFDYAHTSYELLSYIIPIFLRLKKKFFTVYGQHDLRYHSMKSLANTPLNVLLLAIGGVFLKDTPYSLGDIDLYGMNWGESQFPSLDSSKFNILSTHRMVINDSTLWDGQEDFIEGNNLLRLTDFDMIISGDNHQSFVNKFKHKLLINSGSLLRLNKSQIDHKPRVGLVTVDVDNKDIKFEWIYIPIKNSEDCFVEDLVKTEDIGADSIEIDTEFIEKLKKTKSDNVKFIHVLQESLSMVEDDYVLKALNDIIHSIINNDKDSILR